MASQDRKTVNGDAEVPHAVVRIPAEFVEDFRAALLNLMNWVNGDGSRANRDVIGDHREEA